MGLSHNIADWLLDLQAVKLNVNQAFTWSSGLKSPIYCDNRKILSYPEVRSKIVKAFYETSGLFGEVKAIAGVATAGIAWGVLLAERLQVPFAYVRTKPKDHGLKNMIEGELSPNTPVLVIEDLISTGSSSLDVIRALEEAGHQILGLLAIFQYNLQATQAIFQEKNIHFTTLTDFSTLLERALLRNFINKTDYENLLNWNSDPLRWSESYQTKNNEL